jgi:hypothetical protein
MGGGTKLLRLEENGCTGVRDFDELAGYDFATYCSAEATRWGGDHINPVSGQRASSPPGRRRCARPVRVRRLLRRVLIPDSQIDEVLAEARKVEAADAASRDQTARERVRVNDHSSSSHRACSTRGAPFAWKQHSPPTLAESAALPWKRHAWRRAPGCPAA